MKKKYGLLGYPLSHSFSKKFFTEKFAQENSNAIYQNFEIDSVEKFLGVIKNTPELIGLNVTIPYKQEIIPFLHELSNDAKEIGAVNTIRITKKGTEIHLKGFNTDTFGFKSSLLPLLKNHHKKALILGTGGAAKAVKYVLTNLGISHISATRREAKMGEINYKDIDRKTIDDNLLIVNTTPLGTYPNVDTYPNIPYSFIGSRHLLFDLVYNPELTQFMAKGKENGAIVKNGYEMLVKQAEKAYEIWNLRV